MQVKATLEGRDTSTIDMYAIHTALIRGSKAYQLSLLHVSANSGAPICC
jgi:hypothetical protein